MEEIIKKQKKIVEFKSKDNVSFIYVTHDVKSGFVTCKACKNDEDNQHKRNKIAKRKNVTVHDVTYVHNVPTGINIIDIEKTKTVGGRSTANISFLHLMP